MRRSIQSCLRFWAALILAYWIASACYTLSSNANSSGRLQGGTVATADVIYQAFDIGFQALKAQLPELQKQGYTYIQVSPPQKSNPALEWWARYQPIDYTVLESPLGTEKDLKELIDAAHRRTLKVIVDVVLNHMANYGNYAKTLQYPRFSPQDFHPQRCIDYSDRVSVTQGWINCDLPDLETSSPYVREQAQTYLKKLLTLGADGFRFDAAKHIEPEYFREVLSVVPADKFVYGEVIGQTIEESNEYTNVFAVTDFQLVSTMRNAFSVGGDLRSLIDPAGSGQALPGTKAVTFAQNHDIALGQIGYKFSSRDDMLLANAFVLARQDGLPLVYRDDADEAVTRAGVAFHHQMRGEPQYFRNGSEIAQGGDSPNLLFIERGDRGLAIINKAGAAFDVEVARMPGLRTGCYRELHHNFLIAVGKSGDGQRYVTRWGSQRGGMQIGPRDALFFVQTTARECP